MIVAARATGGSALVTPTSTSTLTTRPPGTNLPAPTPPQWTLFDEDHATGAIVDAINGARQVVDAEFFAVAGAGKGAQLTAALVAAARRGVEVNLIADFTSLVAPPPGAFIRMRRDLEQAGAHVVLTSRAPFSRRTRAFPGLGNVDHRKVISVDSTTAFTGGMNFTTITDSGFRDSMVRLSGIPAARLAADQLDRWQRVGGAVSATHRTSVRDALGDAPQIPSDANELAVLSNAPEQRRFDLSNAYRDLIRGAQRRIWLTTPGLSDQSLIGDINAAAKRGVDVRIITSGAPILGVRLLYWVGRSHLKPLSGVG
ncbi:MAG: Cardiolipin synthetase, partial [Thermoleophilia bacterium]|nr:Cardiolipin synthetase [Thermoleophilia bacterium]